MSHSSQGILRRKSDAYLSFAVGTICDLLHHAAAGTDVAFNVSDALYRLHIHTRGPDGSGMSHQDRALVLEAFLAARHQILALFKPAADQAIAAKAIDGVAGLLTTAPESCAPHGLRSHVPGDCVAYARWLRNACHNHSLLSEIETRADGRRAIVVRDMIEKALV